MTATATRWGLDKDTPAKLTEHIKTRWDERGEPPLAPTYPHEVIEFAVDETVDEGWHYPGTDCLAHATDRGWYDPDEDPLPDGVHRDGMCPDSLDRDDRDDLARWLDEHHFANHDPGSARHCRQVPCAQLIHLGVVAP